MGGRVAKLQNRRPVKTPKRQNHDFLDFAVKTPKRQNHDFLAFAGSQNLTILKEKILLKTIDFQLRLWNPQEEFL